MLHYARESISVTCLLEFKPKTWHYEFDESGNSVMNDPVGIIPKVQKVLNPDQAVNEPEGIRPKVQGDVGVVPTQFSDPANCTSGVG